MTRVRHTALRVLCATLCLGTTACIQQDGGDDEEGSMGEEGWGGSSGGLGENGGRGDPETLGECLAGCPEPGTTTRCRTACTSDGICATGECREVPADCPRCEACRESCQQEFSNPEPPPSGEEGGPDAPAPSAGDGTLACGGFVECIQACEGDEPCFDRCESRTCNAARGRFVEMVGCFQESGCNSGDGDCLRERCGGRIQGCFDQRCSGAEPPPASSDALACGGLLECVIDCPSEDTSCVNRCGASACDSAKGRFGALVECLQGAECPSGDNECIDARCGRTIRSCVDHQCVD